MATHKADSTYKYHAFISYRHADNKVHGRQWATWLHQAIETYDVPKDLVGKKNGRGDVIPARIYPIFRDEEELPAHADLGTSIVGALEQTNLLVVLCSPRAVASTYVADEIDYFKKLGGSDRIIAAMIDGEPNTSWDDSKLKLGFTKEDECFPLPLQFEYDQDGNPTEKHAEPIAADFRINNDGKPEQGFTTPAAYREHLKKTTKLDNKAIDKKVNAYQQQIHLMLLKIIAGILGVPLGELTQRDKEYQLEQERLKAKKLRQWLGAVVMLAIVAVGTGVFAYFQKEKAQEATIQVLKEKERAEKSEKTAIREQEKAQLAEKAAKFERDNALNTQGLFLVDLAKQENQKGFYDTGLLLSLNALPGGHGGERPFSNEMRDSLYQSVKNVKKKAILRHNSYARGVEYSEDGKLILTHTQNGDVIIWDSEQANKKQILKHNGSILAAHFSPDNTKVVTASFYHPVRVWSVESGKLLYELIHPGIDSNGSAGYVTFSPKGTYILTARFGSENYNSAYLWSTQTGEKIGNYGHSGLSEMAIVSAQFSDDESSLTTMSTEIAVQWGVKSKTRKNVIKFKERSDDKLKGSSDNIYFYRIGAGFEQRDNIVDIWEVNSGKKVFSFSHKEKINSAQFSNDNKMLITSSDDNTSIVYSLSTGNVISLFNYESNVIDASFHNNGSYIYNSLEDGSVLIRSFETGEILSAFNHQYRATQATFHPSTNNVITRSSNNVHVWEYEKSQHLKLNSTSTFLHSNISSDGEKIAAYSNDGVVTIWSVLTGNKLFDFKPNSYVYHLEFTSDSTKLVVAEGNKTGAASIWSLATKSKIHTFNHKGIVNHASFNKNGTKVITASRDRTASIWDMETGQKLLTLTHSSSVFRAGFSNDSLTVFTIPVDKTAIIWSASDGQKIATTPKAKKLISTASFDPTDKYLITYIPREGILNIFNSSNGHQVVSINKNVNSAKKLFDYLGNLLPLKEQSISKNNLMFLIDENEFHFKNDFRNLHKMNGESESELSGDGEKFVSVRKNEVKVFSSLTGLELDSLKHQDVSSAYFTPDGKKLISLGGKEIMIRQLLPLKNLKHKALQLLPQNRRCLTTEERNKFFLPKLSDEQRKFIGCSNHE